MAQFVRTMNFHSRDLGKTSTFVLTFDDEETPGIYSSVFPTTFRASVFGERGSYVFTVTYVSQLGFTRTQIKSGIVQPASTYVPINIGQQTTLTNNEGVVYSFSDPTDIVPKSDEIKCLNHTNDRQDIGLGVFDENPDNAPYQVLVFDDVEIGSSAQVVFTPVISGYITSDYQENEVLRSKIASQNIFNYDLADLNTVTDWDLEYNPSGPGTYTLTERN